MLTIEQIQQAIDEKKYLTSSLDGEIFLGIPKKITEGKKINDVYITTEWDVSNDIIWIRFTTHISHFEKILTEEEFYNALFEQAKINDSYKMTKFGGIYPLGLGNRIEFTFHEPLEVKAYSFQELFNRTESSVVKSIKN